MKQLTLTIEQARELRGKSTELDELIRQTWADEELDPKPWRVKRWEDFGEIMGHFVFQATSKIGTTKADVCDSSKNIFYTEQQARSFGIVYAQLTQLMARFRQGWEPDWKDASQPKFVVTWLDGSFIIKEFHYTKEPLSFQSREVAKAFLEYHRELIEEFYKGM